MGSPPCNGVYHMNPSTSSFDLHPSVNVTQMLPSWRWDLLLRPSSRCSIPGQLMELKYMKLASRTHRHKLTTKSLQQWHHWHHHKKKICTKWCPSTPSFLSFPSSSSYLSFPWPTVDKVKRGQFPEPRHLHPNSSTHGPWNPLTKSWQHKTQSSTQAMSYSATNKLFEIILNYLKLF